MRMRCAWRMTTPRQIRQHSLTKHRRRTTILPRAAFGCCCGEPRLGGHALEGEGNARLVHQINQMMHLLAAGLWLGGLVRLAWLLGWARSPSGAVWISVARDVVPRFSQMGYVAVALPAATGALNTLLLVGSFRALVGTPTANCWL